MNPYDTSGALPTVVSDTIDTNASGMPSEPSIVMEMEAMEPPETVVIPEIDVKPSAGDAEAENIPLDGIESIPFQAPEEEKSNGMQQSARDLTSVALRSESVLAFGESLRQTSVREGANTVPRHVDASGSSDCSTSVYNSWEISPYILRKLLPLFPHRTSGNRNCTCLFRDLGCSDCGGDSGGCIRRSGRSYLYGKKLSLRPLKTYLALIVNPSLLVFGIVLFCIGLVMHVIITLISAGACGIGCGVGILCAVGIEKQTQPLLFCMPFLMSGVCAVLQILLAVGTGVVLYLLVVAALRNLRW